MKWAMLTLWLVVNSIINHFQMDNTELINRIISPATELRDAQYDLTSNYKGQIAGGTTFQVPKLKAPVDEFKDILEYVSKDALECLPPFRLQELSGYLLPIFAKLSSLHNYKREPDRTDQDQMKQFEAFFTNQNDPAFYLNVLPKIWTIVVESLTLLSTKKISGSALVESLRGIQDYVGKAKGVLDEVNGILATVKAKMTKQGISEHETIFSGQSDRHQLNATIWGIISILLVAGDACVIMNLYSEVKGLKPEEISIQFSVLVVLIISLISYTILVSVKNYMAEKHNQIITKHKANYLGTYDTFAKSAPDEIRNVILQFTTQTIFSQYSPGYLNKDPIQSPSPIIEMLRNVSNEKSK